MWDIEAANICGNIFLFRENDIENFAAFTKKMDDGVRALTGAATDQIKRYSVSKSILKRIYIIHDVQLC